MSSQLQVIESPNLSIMPASAIAEYFLSQQSSGTSRTYSSAIRAFFAWSGKDYREVTPFDALNYDAYLKSTVAPSTVQRHISTMTRFFAFAIRCQLLQVNPFAVVKQRSVPNRAAEKFLSKKELSRLLEELKQEGMREYVLGLVLASTGLRISEAHSLSWSSFIESPDDGILVRVLRKGGKWQMLPIRNDVWEVIRAYMGREIDVQDHSPLFLNPSLNRCSVRSLREWITCAAKRAGIKKHVSPHVLRHTFATISLSSGAALRDVQEYMNHKSIKTTEGYLHAQNMKVGEFMPIVIQGTR